MDHPQEVLDLSIVFTQPLSGSLPKTLAHVTFECDALGLNHTGEVFTDPLTQRERDDLRWYLEEYWQWPYLEFAERGKRVEALLGDVGRRFYQTLFEKSEAKNIVQAWQQYVGVQHRISIVSEIASILRLPWELLADPQGFLLLHADQPISVVRRLPTQGEQTPLTTSFQPPLRILLVTARPEGAGFVDPRSISRELVDALQRQSEAGTIELEFLRPPTFAALNARLKNTNHPIHVLHFDGHGGLGGKKQQGVLLFEDKGGKPSPVEASDLAKVLKNSDVRLAVLTACQSAMGTKEDDTFSSISTQLINNGVDAVIAMNSSILVTSAALYVEAFYHALAEGLPVSIAQEQARQALQRNPYRYLFRRRQDEEASPVKLADWWVPHFYQQRPLTLPATAAPRKHAPLPRSTPIRFNDAMPPEPRYHFSGRARELLQIERHLLRQRLVVLSGFGGIGKTALAREAADWFTRTGIYTSACFVSFEHGGDAAMLLSELGTFLGIQDGSYNSSDSDAALARLQPVLRERPTLLIADNLESLLPTGEAPLEREARGQLWHVLRELAALSAGVLLTTRDPLGGRDQPAPSANVAYLPLRGLAPYDAYALATRLLEDLAIDRTCAPYAELRDLLLKLDHHPLAIQLVFPTLRERALADIRTDFTTLLPTFADDTDTGRNRSLLASLDYSLRRLTDAQRALLPYLAFFEAGAREADILAITRIPEADWAELRQALEQAALLTPEPVAGFTLPFLRFHPVLTPYLRSQLGAAMDPTLRARFARHYAGLSSSLHNKDTQHPQAVRTLFQLELPNLRQALVFLLETGDLEIATALVSNISYFLSIFGRWRERDKLRQRIGVAITAQQTVSDADGLSWTEFLQEGGLGKDEWGRGNLRAATTRFTRLLARIEASPAGTPLSRGSHAHSMLLVHLAGCLRDCEQMAAAERILRQALAITDALLLLQPENIRYRGQRAGALTFLADVLAKQGQYLQARELYVQGIEIHKQLGDQTGQAEAESQLGTLALEQEDYAEAQTRYLAALHIFQELDEPPSVAGRWHQLGVVAEAQHQWNEAERCYRASLAIRESLGDAAEAAKTCNQLAMVALETGRSDEAEGWYRRALELDEQAHPSSPDPGYLHNLALLLVEEASAGLATPARLAESKRLAKQALSLEETREVLRELWVTLDLLARIADLEGETEVARCYRRRAGETYAAFAGNRFMIDRRAGELIVLIAASTQGNRAAKQVVEVALPQLEANGWQIAAATRRIWAGERDWHALVEDLGYPSYPSALLILRVLETIAALAAEHAQPMPEATLASLPTPMLDALQQGDQAAFFQALVALVAPAEQQRVLAALQMADEGESKQGA